MSETHDLTVGRSSLVYTCVYQQQLTIKYKEGDETYTNYETLEADFTSGKLHPSDLKPAVTLALDKVHVCT